jgi:hypothetical protein
MEIIGQTFKNFTFSWQRQTTNTVFHASVEGPCLHRLENWLVRQLNDRAKPVYKMGFIREEGKATARELQRRLEAGGSLHR